MRASRSIVTLLAASLCLAACSSRPRPFAPVASASQHATPTDAAAFDQAWHQCRAEIAARTDQRSGRLTSAAGGAAIGAGTAAAVGATTAGTYATMGGAMAAASATIIAAPIGLIGGAWGLAKMKKTRKERAIREATTACLERRGQSVASWRRLTKAEARALDRSTAPTEPAPAPAPR